MLTRDKTPFEQDYAASQPVWREKLRRLLHDARDMLAFWSEAGRKRLFTFLASLWHDPLYVRLPFEERRLGLTLAALLSITLYVAFLSIAVNQVLGHAAMGMDREMARRITFEVLPDPAHPGDAKEKKQRTDVLVEKLRSVTGVKKVEALSDEKMSSLLSPWLGTQAPPPDLPLPALIDVEVDQPNAAVKEALGKTAAGVANVLMDDHAIFEGALFRTVRSLQFTAFYVLLLGLAALLLTSYFAAETHFYMNRETIEILHIVGAKDSAIARHMGLAVLRLGFAGACAAFALGVITLMALGASSQGLDLSLFPNFSLGFAELLGMVILWAVAGLVAVGLCFATAYISVLRALRRMI